MNLDIERVLFTQQEIKETVEQLGKQITQDYKDKQIYMICILKGSIVFTADLMRCIDLPVIVDTMQVSSYGSGAESSGTVNIEQGMCLADVSDKHLLLIEDIVDTGNTLNALRNLLIQEGAASVKICTLLDKPERRVLDIPIDYCGFQVPNAFIVGYGLDYAQLYRNLPYIGILKKQVYER